MNITLKDIKDRTEEIGDCWIWQQGTTQQGYPVMKPRGCKCQTVRRIVLQLQGKKVAARQPVTTTCDERLCVNPAHVKASTTSAVALTAAAQGKMGGPRLGAAIAGARRRLGLTKLTMEDAVAIRACTGRLDDMAARFGVDVSQIKRVRRGEAWKDYSSPFAGLGR